MTYNYYKTLIGEYINLGRSEERLLGEIGFPPEIKWDGDGLVKAIGIIGAAADRDVKRLVELSGLTMTSFGRMFNISYRTIQDWCGGQRKPPEYLPMLIGYVLVNEIEECDNGDI